MQKEFGTSEFSLSKLHQLSINSQDTTAQHFFRRQMREYYFDHFNQTNEHFFIPTERTELLIHPMSWEQLESYCNLPFEDMQGNQYKLTSSRSNSHNGHLTIDFHSTDLVKDEHGKVGYISGHLGYDEEGRLKFGHQNRFTPQDPMYLFNIDYSPRNNYAVAFGEYFTPGGEKLDIPIEDMPFFNEQFLMVDVAEVMRQSR